MNVVDESFKTGSIRKISDVYMSIFLELGLKHYGALHNLESR